MRAARNPSVANFILLPCHGFLAMGATIPSNPNPSPLPGFAQVARVFGDKPFRTDADVHALAFSAADQLWSVEDGGVLRQWDVATGRPLSWHELEQDVTLWAFDPGGRTLA